MYPCSILKIHYWIFIGIFIFYVSSPSISVSADDPSDPFEDPYVQQALEKVKGDLLTELKSDHMLGPDSRFADKLGKIDAKNLGDFLGSLAGGDYNSAFNAIGKEGANYFMDDFLGKATEFLGGKDSPLVKYLPANLEDSKKALQKVFQGKFGEAGTAFKTMVKKEGRSRAEEFSKEVVTKGIDWVLKDLTGGSPGAFFIKAVELEMEAIKFSEKALKRYFSGEVLEYYNNLRGEGKSASEAYDMTFSLERGRFPMAEIRNFGIREQKNVRLFMEQKYMDTIPWMRTIETKQDQLAAQAMSPLQQRLIQERQRILQAIQQVAENNPDIKKLVAAFREAFSKLKMMDQNIKALETARTTIKDRIDPAEVKKLVQELEQKKKSLEKLSADAQTLSQKCVALDSLEQDFNNEKERIETRLEKIKEVGKKYKKAVKKTCDEAEEDPEKTKRRIKTLKETLREIRDLEPEMEGAQKKAAKKLLEIKVIKDEYERVKQEMDKLTDVLERSGTLTKGIDIYEKAANLAMEGIEKQHSKINNIINPYRKYAADILKKADQKKSEASKIKKDIDSLLSSGEKEMEKITTLKTEIQGKIKEIKSTLSSCDRLKDLDPQELMNDLNELMKRYKKYLQLFQKYYDKARECAGLPEEDACQKANDELGGCRGEAQKVQTPFEIAQRALTNASATAGQINALSGSVSSLLTEASLMKNKCTAAGNLLSQVTKASNDAANRLGSMASCRSTAAEKESEACRAATDLQNVSEMTKAQIKALETTAKNAAAESEAAAGECTNKFMETLKSKAEAAVSNGELKKELNEIETFSSKPQAVMSKLAPLEGPAGEALSNAETAKGQPVTDAESHASGAEACRERVTEILRECKNSALSRQIGDEAKSVASNARSLADSTRGIAAQAYSEASDAIATLNALMSDVNSVIAWSCGVSPGDDLVQAAEASQGRADAIASEASQNAAVAQQCSRFVGAVSTTRDCGSNAYWDENKKKCECNSGYEKINGQCVKKCGKDESRNASGICVFDPGAELECTPETGCDDPEEICVNYKCLSRATHEAGTQRVKQQQEELPPPGPKSGAAGGGEPVSQTPEGEGTTEEEEPLHPPYPPYPPHRGETFGEEEEEFVETFIQGGGRKPGKGERGGGTEPAKPPKKPPAPKLKYYIIKKEASGIWHWKNYKCSETIYGLVSVSNGDINKEVEKIKTSWDKSNQKCKDKGCNRGALYPRIWRPQTWSVSIDKGPLDKRPEMPKKKSACTGEMTN